MMLKKILVSGSCAFVLLTFWGCLGLEQTAHDADQNQKAACLGDPHYAKVFHDKCAKYMTSQTQ